MKWILVCLLFFPIIAARPSTTPLQTQPPATSSEIETTDRFEFYSNFWMNLHHFLYRCAGEAGESDWKSLAGEGFSGQLSDEDESAFTAAIQYYREHLVDQNLLFNDQMYRIKRALIHFEVTDKLEHEDVDPALAAVLNTVSEPYRSHIWEAHDRQNRTALGEHLTLIRKIENGAFDRIAKLAQQPWPGRKVRVDISFYSNWAGGYTTVMPTHAVVTSQAEQPQERWPDSGWIELLFHESTHEIILPNRYPVGETVNRISNQLEADVPDGLWHAMLFYFAGTAVRDLLASEGIEHELMMVTNDIFSRYHDVVFAYMPAYLEGEDSLEGAVRKSVTDLSH